MFKNIARRKSIFLNQTNERHIYYSANESTSHSRLLKLNVLLKMIQNSMNSNVIMNRVVMLRFACYEAILLGLILSHKALKSHIQDMKNIFLFTTLSKTYVNR